MFKQLRKLGKDTVVYGIGNALKRGIGFLLLPVYTRFLTPADYGKLELLNVTSIMLFVFTVQGLTTAFLRFHADAKSEREKYELISTSFYYLVLSALTSCGLLYIFAEQYGAFVFGETDQFSIFVKIMVFTAFFEIASLTAFQLFRVTQQSVKYVIVVLAGFLTNVGFNIYFVVGLKLSIKGVLLGNCISALIVLFINLFLIRQSLVFKISGSKLREMLRFGLPLVFASLFIWVLQISDRFLLQRLSSTEELGWYSLAYRFATIMSFLAITPFSTAWGAHCFQIATRDDAQKTFATITTFWLLILCVLASGLVILTPFVIKLMADEAFWVAQQAVFPLVCMMVVNGMFTIFDLGINVAKRTQYMAYIVGVGAVMNVGLNVILIPGFGMMGAAYASLASFGAITMITYFVSQKVYFIPFQIARLIKLMMLFLAVTYTSTMFESENMWLDLALRLGLIVVFFVSIPMSGFFYDNEKDYAKSVWREVRGKKGLMTKLEYGLRLIRTTS